MIRRIRSSDVVRHGAIVFGAVAAGNVFNYLFYMLTARVGGVVVYGEVTALSSALLVVGAPAAVGQLIVAKIAADLDAAGDRQGLRRLADLVTRVTGIAGVVLFLAVTLARDPLARFFNLGDAMPVVATGASLATYLVAYVQRGVLQGAHRFDRFAASLALEAVARVALGVALVIRFGSAGALFGAALGIGVAVAYNALAFRRVFGASAGSVRFDRASLLRIVGGVGAGQLTLTVLTFYDVPLVKHAFTARDAGLYAAAALVGRAVIAAAAFVPTIVLPKATARVAAGRSPHTLLAAAVGAAGGLAAVAALACLVAPRLIVTVIAGRAFGDAASLVLLYAIASGALSVATVVAAYSFGLHRYAFVVPMCAAACVEVATLAAWHPSLRAVVLVLLAGHTAVLLASLYRVTAVPRAHGPADAETAETFLATEPTVG